MTQFHEHLEQVIAHSKEKKMSEPPHIPISGLVQKHEEAKAKLEAAGAEVEIK